MPKRTQMVAKFFGIQKMRQQTQSIHHPTRGNHSDTPNLVQSLLHHSTAGSAANINSTTNSSFSTKDGLKKYRLLP